MKRRELFKGLLVAPLALLGWKPKPTICVPSIFNGPAHGVKRDQVITLNGSVTPHVCWVTGPNTFIVSGTFDMNGKTYPMTYTVSG